MQGSGRITDVLTASYLFLNLHSNILKQIRNKFGITHNILILRLQMLVSQTELSIMPHTSLIRSQRGTGGGGPEGVEAREYESRRSYKWCLWRTEPLSEYAPSWIMHRNLGG